jgi:hypothetical protein
MTTAIIGTGRLGSVIARHLGSGGEILRLASADTEAARSLAAQIGAAAVAAKDNRDAVRGADAVVLALRFTVLESVLAEIAGSLTGKVVVVPSNPLSTDAHGQVYRVLAAGQSSGEVVDGWLPPGVRLALAFGTMSADIFESAANRSPEPAVLFYASDDRADHDSAGSDSAGSDSATYDRADDHRASAAVERLIRAAGFEPVRIGGIEQSGRLEVGGDLHDLVVGPAQARSMTGVA